VTVYIQTVTVLQNDVDYRTVSTGKTRRACTAGRIFVRWYSDIAGPTCLSLDLRTLSTHNHTTDTAGTQPITTLIRQSMDVEYLSFVEL